MLKNNNFFSGLESKEIPISRLFAIASLSFALTLVTNILDPAIFGHKILKIAQANQHNTILGFSTFMGSLASIVVLPIIGVLSDHTKSKLGRRMPYFIIGTIFLIFAMYIIAASSSVISFGLGVVLYYIASNVIDGPWMALFPNLIPNSIRGQASGIKALLDITALIIGRQTAGNIMGNVDSLGETAVYYSIAIPSTVLILSLLITWNIIKDKNQFPSELPPLTIKNIFGDIINIDLKAYPSFKWWFANRFFFWAAFNILGTFLLFFTMDVIGLKEAEAQKYLGTLTSIIGGGILFIAIPAGKLADTIGRKPLVMISGILAGLGTFSILLTTNLQLLIVSGGLIGVAAGIFISSNFALLTDIVPKDEAGKYMGVAMIASAGGSAIARLIGGIIIDPINNFNNNQSSGYIALYSIASVFYFFSAYFANKLPSHNKLK